MLVASFTLLPALLALLGERAFWLAFRGVADAPDDRGRRWARVADLVRRRPRRIVATVLAALALLSLGNLVDHGTIGFGQGRSARPNPAAAPKSSTNTSRPAWARR